VWPKDAVEKGAELSAWIKSAWHETVAVIEDGSGNLTSRYVGATAADKLLVLTRLVMLNDRERVWIVHSIGRVGRRVKNGGHRDGGKVEEEVGNGEGCGTVHEEDTNVGRAKSGMAGKKAGGFTGDVGVGPNEGGEGAGVLEDGIRGVADPVVYGHFGRLGTGEEMVTVWIHGFGAGAMGWEVVEREAKFAFDANHPEVRGRAVAGLEEREVDEGRGDERGP
jgi:hypothetical protein